MRRRLLVSAITAVALPLLALPSLAANPAAGTVGPSSPTLTFKGDPQLAAANPAGVSAGCPPASADPGNVACDHFALTSDVSASYWDTHTGGIDLTLDWADAGNDFDVYVFDAAGNVVASSASSGKPESVQIPNAAGTYDVAIAPFLVVDDQATGVATFMSADKATGAQNPLFPNGDPQGLAFSATIPSDPQRSQGEPAVTTDLNGRIYSCGPTGFSSVNDFASVSTDGGDQFHLLGSPPRGQLSTAEGGGDCALATSPVKNDAGDYTLAYAGLGPLTNFSTATSDDGGRTLTGSPVSESNPGVDRQWITFLDDKTAVFTYNGTAPSGKTVQISTDGGLTYGKSFVATPDGGRIGQIRSYLPAGKTDRVNDSVVYIPYTNGTNVKMAISFGGGQEGTFKTCTILDAGVSPDGGFTAADHDNAGNIYFTYTEKGGERDTYLVPVPKERLTECTGDANLKSAKTRLNTLDVETTLFPWIAARGEPGRVAVAFYGTDQIGDPDSAAFDAAWNVYVTQSLNALDAQPTVAMVKATTHPFHYDSICTNGLGCTISGSDRSLVDYFTMEQNVANGSLAIVYEQAAKMPDEASGHVATPAVITQVAGPSNNGSVVDRGFRKQVTRTSSPDPADDAIAGYSVLNTGADVFSPADNHVPALDLVDGATGSPAVKVGPQLAADGTAVADGGFSVTLQLADLSDAALQSALTSAGGPTGPGVGQSLVYLFRFVDGYQSAGVSARWDPATGFDFAYTGYQVGSAVCGSSGEECTTYNSEVPLEGVVDQEAGTIRIDVPVSLLTALAYDGALPGNRPSEVAASTGDLLYDGTAVTLINPSQKDAQSFMEQVDGAAAFDFVLGDAGATGPVVPEVPLAALLPLAALAIIGTVVIRRRTVRG